ANNIATADRLERGARRLLGRDSVHRRVNRNAFLGMEFRSHTRTPMAFRRSAIDRRGGAKCVAAAPAFEYAPACRILAHRVRHDRLSTVVLGLAECFSFRVSGGGRSWFH